MVYLDCKFTSFFNKRKKNSTFFKKITIKRQETSTTTNFTYLASAFYINNYELHELNKWAYAFLILSNYTNFSIWGSALH